MRDGWMVMSQAVPNHGSKEMGKGLEKKILKDAGIKLK